MPSEVERFIRDAAEVRGISPDVAVIVAKSEGGVDEYARRGTFATGSSWWPFQLHYGGPGYEQYGTVAGMGTGFTELTGWQPGDPRAWRDSVRYALNRAKAGGWTPWYGAAAAGVSRWYGIDRSVSWDANAETWDYERPGQTLSGAGQSLSGEGQQMSGTAIIAEDDVNIRSGPGTSHAVLHAPLKAGSVVWPTDAAPVTAEGHTWRQVSLGLVGWVAEEYLSGGAATEPPAAPSPGYDPDTPVVTQNADWDCAQQSTLWGLTALGRHPADSWMEADMLARGVESLTVGLTDATGAKLAAWVREQYGEFGISAYNLSPVTFAQVAHLAGTTPVLIGGHGWGAEGHWCGVRRYGDAGLELAQVGGHGPVYGQQTLDRSGWDARGPWSAVVIERKA